MEENKLIITGVSKSYIKGKKALDDVSCIFENGVYGILGPNGAGKSTLMNIITGSLKPDTGNVQYNLNDIFKMGGDYRSLVGYVPQQQKLFEEFTGRQFLFYLAALKGLNKKQSRDEVKRVLEKVNLADVQYKKIKFFSGGMKQRMLIAQALMGNPKIIVLDEPTVGLDPEERLRVKTYIKDLSKDIIVLLTTHIVSDVEDTADKIIMMKKGRIVKSGTYDDIVQKSDGTYYDGIEAAYMDCFEEKNNFIK